MLEHGLAGLPKDWPTAAKEGAKKGRHEPARDGLLYLGVIEPLTTGGPTVQIAVGCDTARATRLSR